jgi:hypothetical protein
VFIGKERIIMRMRLKLLRSGFLLAIPLLMTNCSPAATIAPSSVSVHFWISNQSLGTGIPAVQMTVNLDGTVIFDESMTVGTQHNVAVVDQNTSTGPHTITVGAGAPYSLSEEAVVDVSGELWILVRFWYDPISVQEDQRTPTITVDVFDKSPGIK